MLKRLFLATMFSLAHCVCQAQTPNAVPMKLEPFPEDNWYIYLWGYYGHQNEETNIFVKDSVRLQASRFLGKEWDSSARSTIDYFCKWWGSDYEIEVVTDLGTSEKHALGFRLMSEDSPISIDYEDDWAKYARVFKAYVLVQGQPVGFRFFERGETEPFKEVMYEDPGEPPKLWMLETVFVPEGIVWDPDFAPGSTITELEGEGYSYGITPQTVIDKSTHISYDEGTTWRYKGVHSDVFPPKRLAQNPHPIIKVTAYHRMRRYVKYYTYKKGFSDAPGGPYEPTTLEELQEQENRKKLEDTTNNLKVVEDGDTEDTTDRNKAKTDVANTEVTTDRPKSIEDGGTEDTADCMKAIADESIAETATDRPKSIIDKSGADGDN